MSIAYSTIQVKIKHAHSLEEIMASVNNVGEKVEDDNIEPLEILTHKEAITPSRTFHNSWIEIEKTTL